MPSATVLIVDDDHLVRWALNDRLVAAGHTVLQAGSAKEALALCAAERQHPDVVLLDLRLPDAKDLELLEVLRSRHPDCRVIVLTANDSPEIGRKALAAGAFVVRLKPFNLDDMEALVASAIAR